MIRVVWVFIVIRLYITGCSIEVERGYRIASNYAKEDDAFNVSKSIRMISSNRSISGCFVISLHCRRRVAFTSSSIFRCGPKHETPKTRKHVPRLFAQMPKRLDTQTCRTQPSPISRAWNFVSEWKDLFLPLAFFTCFLFFSNSLMHAPLTDLKIHQTAYCSISKSCSDIDYGWKERLRYRYMKVQSQNVLETTFVADFDDADFWENLSSRRRRNSDRYLWRFALQNGDSC